MQILLVGKTKRPRNGAVLTMKNMEPPLFCDHDLTPDSCVVVVPIDTSYRNVSHFAFVARMIEYVEPIGVLVCHWLLNAYGCIAGVEV
jgi:hypothetical protein